LFYDEGNFFSEQNIRRNGFENAFEAGLKISYELKINRLSFISDAGIFLQQVSTCRNS